MTRINQNNAEYDWTAFIDAIDKMHGVGVSAPAYRDFVKVHVKAMSAAGMSWKVHTMSNMAMQGINFLSWHRWFVLQFERRLQKINSNVTIPYWNAIADRKIPIPLQDKKLLKRLGVKRQWDESKLPTQADLDAAKKVDTFDFFQRTLEGPVHGGVHNAVGGDMAGPSSPSDPLFWLHHVNLDRIWAEWQKTHQNQSPSNMNDSLQPKPLFGVTVSIVQDINQLGYQYGG